jgi:hypothetical protein
LREGLVGFYNVAAGRGANRPVLTPVDFSRPSQQEAGWVIMATSAALL